MADRMRNRTVYTVFSPEEEGAREILLKAFRETFPEASAEEAAAAETSVDEAIQAATHFGANLALAPSGRLELVSPVDLSIAWEYEESDLFSEITSERERQVLEKGYNSDHDDSVGGDQLIEIAKSYLTFPENTETGEVRRRLVKSIATLVAVVEFIERAERRLSNEAEIQNLEKLLKEEGGDAVQA